MIYAEAVPTLKNSRAWNTYYVLLRKNFFTKKTAF